MSRCRSRGYSQRVLPLGDAESVEEGREVHPSWPECGIWKSLISKSQPAHLHERGDAISQIETVFAEGQLREIVVPA